MNQSDSIKPTASTENTHVRKSHFSAQRGKTRSKRINRVIKHHVAMQRRKENEVLTKSRRRSRKTKTALLSDAPSEFENNEEGCWYEIQSNILDEEHIKKVQESIEYVERLESRDHVVLDDVKPYFEH